MEVFFKFQEEAKNSHDINSKLVSASPIHRQRACCFGNVFICAQHANNGPKNICQMHAQLIREKQRGEEKNARMSRQAARSSRLGIIIDILSGLVLDFEVLSKYCHNCVVAGRDMGVDSAGVPHMAKRTCG
ncbi:hypothetical protein TNCV_3724331 [Trichonephila clavipes]|nr:hypothetical protein TNCV_3724331 [Trichonephila clavipes]